MPVIHGLIEASLFSDPNMGHYLYSCRKQGSRSPYNRKFKAIYRGYNPPTIGHHYAFTGIWMYPDETEKKFVFRYYESLQSAKQKHADQIRKIQSQLNDG